MATHTYHVKFIYCPFCGAKNVPGDTITPRKVFDCGGCEEPLWLHPAKASKALYDALDQLELEAEELLEMRDDLDKGRAVLAWPATDRQEE